MNPETIDLLLWVLGAGAVGGAVTAFADGSASWRTILGTVLKGAITGAFATGLMLSHTGPAGLFLPIVLSAFCGMTQERVQGILLQRLEKLI